MFAANQDKAERSIGRVLKDLGHGFLEQLAVFGDQFRLYSLFSWLQDDAQHDATMRELNLLNDYYLEDIGIKRPFDLKTDDLVKRLRAGG